MIQEPMITKKPKKIKQIVVSKLFETFNYTISLNQEERFTTILVGESGFGKTVILKLLNDLFGKSDRTLRTIPFAEFRVDFEDEEEEDEDDNECCHCHCHKKAKLPVSLWVTKEHANSELTYHFRDQNEQEQTWTSSAQSTGSYSTMEEKNVPELAHAGKRSSPTRAILSFEDVLQRTQMQPMREDPEMPDWLAEARQAIPVYFIGTQRLLSFLDTSAQNGSGVRATVVPTATVYAEELTELVKEGNSALSEFPERLNAIEKFINEFFLHKKLIIDQEEGVTFIDDNGIHLAPEELSLGEQNAFVLFYELLFKAPAGALVLIDEPDIAFHIVWQHDFVPILAKVGAPSDLTLLLVTHSPSLIRNRWHLVVPLEEV